MGRRKKTYVAETNFDREYEYQIGNDTLTPGDLFKVTGEYGMKFKFHSVVTNKLTGAQWIDCFEVRRNMLGAQRSFKFDRIKRIPRKRRKKNVD